VGMTLHPISLCSAQARKSGWKDRLYFLTSLAMVFAFTSFKSNFVSSESRKVFRLKEQCAVRSYDRDFEKLSSTAAGALKWIAKC